MIKINLLEVDKERRVKTVSTGGVPTSLLALVIIGLSIAAFVFYLLAKQKEVGDLEDDIAKKRIQKKELEPYIKRVEELDQRRQELAQKNHAIELLRSQRTIPVHIMDEISRALPDYLWITNLTLQGELLSIDGATLQEQAIPTFMKNLDASEFIGICSLIETRQALGQQQAATSFKISAPITNPFKPKEPVPAAASSRRRTQAN
jgi:type IV pilus assembly protein PilN